MGFEANWTELADSKFRNLQAKAIQAHAKRQKHPGKKKSKVEGIFAQLQKAISMLLDNPRHPGLRTHPFKSKQHPFDENGTVFEAYIQNRTPGAYRLFGVTGLRRGR